MKKLFSFAVLALTLTIVLTGCVGVRTPITGSIPGVVYTDTAAGVFVNVPVRPLVEEYKVIKQHAVGRSTSVSVLAIIALDKSTFEKAIGEILDRYPEADEVIDIKVDVEKKNLLLLATSTTLVVRGTAIKYTGKRRTK